MSDRGRVEGKTMSPYGVQPSLYDSLLSDFLYVEYQRDSDLTLS